MANFGFIIDNRRCIGCHACTVACKSEHEVPLGVNRTWVKYIEKGTFPDSQRHFSVMRCNHCDNAPCITICPVTALFRRDDGIVDFDSRRCIGCKACMQACPYDALYIDPESHTAAKCNYCAHRVDNGLEPACVIVCPTQAIISGDLDDPDSTISKLLASEPVTVRKPEKETLPRLYYIDGEPESLDASATDVGGHGMWNRQTRGVGHYARYTEQRVAAIFALSHRSPAQNHSGPEGGNGENEPASKVPGKMASNRVGHVAPSRAPAVVLSKRHPLDDLRNLLGLDDPCNGVVNSDPSSRLPPAAPRSVESGTPRRVYDAPNKGVLWGWQVSAYVWTKAISSGAGLVAALIAILAPTRLTPSGERIAWIVALVFLALTGLMLVADLDRPRRFLYVMLRPQWRSWLVRGAWIINAYAIVLAIWFCVLLAGWSLADGWLPWLVAPIALLTAAYTAFLFAQARGRDFWQSHLLVVHMLVHSLIGGSATLCALASTTDPEWNAVVGRMLIAALIAKLIVDAIELSIPHGSPDSRRVVQMIVRGRFARLYRWGVVAFGCCLPVLLLLPGATGLTILAGVVSLIGLYLAEHIWVRAPQLIPLS